MLRLQICVNARHAWALAAPLALSLDDRRISNAYIPLNPVFHGIKFSRNIVPGYLEEVHFGVRSKPSS